MIARLLADEVILHHQDISTKRGQKPSRQGPGGVNAFTYKETNRDDKTTSTFALAPGPNDDDRLQR